MKNKVAKEMDRYMSLPYTVVLRRDEEGDFIAKVPELPGCVAHGGTETEALTAIKAMQRLWLEEALESGRVIPRPELDEQLPSGKWLQRAPRSLHGRLSRIAKREAVSLNQLVTSMLAEAVASWTADRTESQDCKHCPLNRADIWDRAFEVDPAWRVETATSRKTAGNLDRVKNLFASRLEYGNENERFEDAIESETCTTH